MKFLKRKWHYILILSFILFFLVSLTTRIEREEVFMTILEVASASILVIFVEDTLTRKSKHKGN